MPTRQQTLDSAQFDARDKHLDEVGQYWPCTGGTNANCHCAGCVGMRARWAKEAELDNAAGLVSGKSATVEDEISRQVSLKLDMLLAEIRKSGGVPQQTPTNPPVDRNLPPGPTNPTPTTNPPPPSDPSRQA